uniref:Hexosyltransferase n=1 Tax=Schistosoma mansoni TaxID=6183 RepID=A0A5K4F646_SCHMA
MSQIQRGLIIISSGCIIYLVILWLFSIKLLIYHPSLYTINENEYFKNCIKSKHSWIKCTKYLNRISNEKIISPDSYSQRWPPPSVTYLIDKRLNSFNLALQFSLAHNATDSKDEDLYNKFADMKPINNPEMFALRVPESVCRSYNNELIPHLIVIIKSSVYNFEKRDRARRTFMQKQLWPNFSVQFVFVLGIPMENESNLFRFDGNTYILDTKWWEFSKHYGSSKWSFVRQLSLEVDLYDDLLIGSFHDTYYNLTKKMIFGLRWLSAFCPKQVPLYLFIDDDYDLVPKNVITFYYNNTEDYLRNMNGGYIRSSRTVFRPMVNETSSVWAMTVKEFPWISYPPYYHGLTYIIGANLVHRLATASAFVKEIRIDDAYLGILFNKLNITLVHLNIIGPSLTKKDIMSGGINVHYKISKRIMNWSSASIRIQMKLYNQAVIPIIKPIFIKIIKINIGIRKTIYSILLILFLFYSTIYILNKNNLKNFYNLKNNDTICSYDKLEEITLNELSWINFIYQTKFINYHNFHYLKQNKITNLFTNLISLYHRNDKIEYTTYNNKNTGLLNMKLYYNIRYDNHIIYYFNDDYSMKNKSYISHPILTRNEKGQPIAYILTEHYPKYFNVTKALKAISSGLSLKEIPCNNDDLIAVRLPKRTCNPCSRTKNVNLVVIVKSCVYCFEQRAFARMTYMNKDLWKNFSVQFVFTVGLPTPNETNTYHFDGFMTTLTINSMRLSNKYVSKWSIAKILSNESKMHNDMLIGAFHDTYFNLTSKMMLSLRWATNFCIPQSPLFLFIDDDYLLHPNNTINLIRKFNYSQLKSLAAGSVYFGSVDRPRNGYGGRWAVSYNEYPWDYYPRYFLGIGYFLGADVVHDASFAMPFTKQMRIDDVYLGIILKRLNRTLTHLDNIHINPGKDHLKSGTFLITRYLAENHVNWTTGLITGEKPTKH